MDDQILEIKNTVVEFMANINIRINDLANIIRSGIEFDNNRLIVLADDLYSLSEGLGVIAGYYPMVNFYEFSEKLELMIRAFENNDVLLYSDIMQYELKPLLEYWADCLKNN